MRENKIWILKCLYNFILISVTFNKFRIDWFLWVFLFFIYSKNTLATFFISQKLTFIKFDLQNTKTYIYVEGLFHPSNTRMEIYWLCQMFIIQDNSFFKKVINKANTKIHPQIGVFFSTDLEQLVWIKNNFCWVLQNMQSVCDRKDEKRN